MLRFRPNPSQTRAVIRSRNRRWLLLALALGLTIVVMGHMRGTLGILRQSTTAPPEPDPAPQRGAQTPEEVPGTVRIAGPRAEQSLPSPAPAGGKSAGGISDVLLAYGIGPAEFEHFVDGRPLDEDETELLVKILFRLRGLRSADLDRWANPPPERAALAAGADAYRGKLFRLHGNVLQVTPIEIAPSVRRRYDIQRCYECVLSAGDGQSARVYVPEVPRAWGGSPAGADPKSAARDPRPAAVRGVFLKLADGAVPLLVAPRIAWYPHTPLGDLGMDVGLLDRVDQGKPLTERDREAFYAMLSAASRAPAGRLFDLAAEALRRSGQEEFSVVPLFNEASDQCGRLVALRGIAERVTRIDVADPEVRAPFPGDHYYEIDLVTDDSQGNPLVFCTAELPEGMPCGSSPGYRERVEVAGFFFKTWAYPVPRMDDDGSVGPKVRTQLAPLLIGQTPRWHPRAEAGGLRPRDIVVAGLLVAGMVGIWLLFWRMRRSDRRSG